MNAGNPSAAFKQSLDPFGNLVPLCGKLKKKSGSIGPDNIIQSAGLVKYYTH